MFRLFLIGAALLLASPTVLGEEAEDEAAERAQTTEENGDGIAQDSAKSVMYSVDFHEIEHMQAAGDWEAATKAMVEAGRLVQSGGAECLLICTNTMHLMAEEVQAAIDIPLLHIADATADAIRAADIRSVALLGTRHTMEQDFYRGRLEGRHGLEVLTPDAADRQIVHDVIYNELVQGVVEDRSRGEFLRIIEALVKFFVPFFISGGGA